jgi:GST-like protein
MLKFYYSLAPNPMKVALFLEEAGLPYQAIPVDTRKGEQFTPKFSVLNPNNKVPVIVDGADVVFDSNAILLYLAEKTGQFVPENRGQALSWLMFIASGIGPFCGQAVHFRTYAPEPSGYALNRYMFEAKRHWGIIESHLGQQPYMAGSTYSYVDMALWGWARLIPFVLGDDGAWQKYPNIKRLLDEVSARPAAARALAIKDRHAFKTEFDDEARKHMFRHTVAQA